MTDTAQTPVVCPPNHDQRSQYAAPTLTQLCLQNTALANGASNDGDGSASNQG